MINFGMGEVIPDQANGFSKPLVGRDSNSPLKGPVTGTKRTAVALPSTGMRLGWLAR